jgi:aminoglycoside phosphotransferase (APT) family kinase protein
MSGVPPSTPTRGGGRAGAAEGSVRPGEAFDEPAVSAWLRGQGVDVQGVANITQFAGGVSNWTYCLAYDNIELVLRRPPAGTKAKSAHDMQREYSIQRALKWHYPVVPTMIAHCADLAVTGTEFYVMTRVAGLIPRKSLPKQWQLSAAEVRAMCLATIDKLVELHQVDYRAAGLEKFYKGPGYVRRQVDGWCERYAKARTWNVPEWSRVKRWLADHAPDDTAVCLIHNDFRFDNCVYAADNSAQVIGLLDWELATVGCPLMDLGSMLAYWVQAADDPLMQLTRRQPTQLPGMLTRREVVEYYFDKSGMAPRDWRFYEVFGLFRLAGIAQQVYYRYHHRQTQNATFKNYWILVNYFNMRCLALIGLGKRR